MKEILKEYKKLTRLKNEMSDIEWSIEDKLKSFLKFDFSLQYFEAEGFCVLHHNLALNVIYTIKKGELVDDEYFEKYGQ